MSIESIECCDLLKSDITLIKPPKWLNDNLIRFYLQYIQHALTVANNDTMMFVEPTLTQLLKELKGGVDVIMEIFPQIAGAMKTKELIFFVVNNASQAGGGSHWSLLVYSKIDQHFVHFDSYRKTNDKDAQIIAEKLNPFCEFPTPFTNNRMCFRQANGYDCGCHVLRNIEIIVNYFLNIGKERPSIMRVHCPTATPEEAEEIRVKIKKLAKSFVL